MSVTVERPPGPPEAEALIEEARRRTRRRRRLLASMLGLLLCAAGLGIGFGVSGSTSPGLSTHQPSFAKAIVGATEAQGSAAFTLTYANRVEGYCTQGQVLNVGQISFAQPAIAFATASMGYDQLNCSEFPVQFRQIGTALYAKFDGHQCHASSCKLLPSGMGWMTLRANLALERGSGVGILRTPYPLAILQAIRSPVHRAGAARVGGIRTTRFTATLTLADLQTFVARTTDDEYQSLAAIGAASGGMPPSSAIKISVTVWIDTADRLVQISVKQPLYVTNPGARGSTVATQYSPDHGQPGASPIHYPFVQGYTTSTLTLSDFGTPVHISPPSDLAATPSDLPGP